MNKLEIRVDRHWFENTPIVILKSDGYVAAKAYSAPDSGDPQVEVAFFDIKPDSLRQMRDTIDGFLQGDNRHWRV